MSWWDRSLTRTFFKIHIKFSDIFDEIFNEYWEKEKFQSEIYLLLFVWTRNLTWQSKMYVFKRTLKFFGTFKLINPKSLKSYIVLFLDGMFRVPKVLLC